VRGRSVTLYLQKRLNFSKGTLALGEKTREYGRPDHSPCSVSDWPSSAGSRSRPSPRSATSSP